MPDWFVGSTTIADLLTRVAVTAVLVVAAVSVISRMAGPRTLGTMTAFDFTANVAVGAVVGSVIVSSSVSVLDGVAAVALLFGLQAIVGIMRSTGHARRVLENDPVLLMTDGEVHRDTLARTRLTEADLRSAMRSVNARHYDDVDLIVLEKSGTLSVVHHSAPSSPLDDRLRSIE